MENKENAENMEKMENINQVTYNTLLMIQNTHVVTQNALFANHQAKCRLPDSF